VPKRLSQSARRHGGSQASVTEPIANQVSRSDSQASKREHANTVLAGDAIVGLKQALMGQFVSNEQLNEALAPRQFLPQASLANSR
jgi:hypothetical protein